MTVAEMGIEDLCNACYEGDDQKVRTILARGLVDVNGFHCGNTPLLYAVAGNQHTVVRTLLASNTTGLDLTGVEGHTALHMAVYMTVLGHSSGILSLLGQDTRCSPAVINTRTKAGDSALMVGVKYSDLDSVRELDKLEGTNFRTRNKLGESLVDVARKKDYAEMVRYLLERNMRKESLAEIAAYNVAKMIDTEEDVKDLEIPLELYSLVTKFLEK